MKIRKAVVFILIALFISTDLCALTIDEILKAAREVSYSVENAELLHSNNLLLLKENELDDEAIWSVELSATPFSSTDFSEEELEIGKLSASVTLADDGRTTIGVSSPMSIGYRGKFFINPKVSASHTFDFNYFDDDMITDLSNASSSLSTERLYLEAIYSFDKSVLSLLENILTLEKEIKSLEHSISNSERDLDNMLSLRQADEESITYRRALLELDMNRRSLDTYKDQYEKAKNQFAISTGLVWDALEEFSVPSLEMKIFDEGNSEVRGLAIDSEVSSLMIEQKEKEIGPISLLLSGSIGGSYRNRESRNAYDEENRNPLGGVVRPWKNSMNGSLGAELSLSNWSIGTEFSLTAEKGETVRPSLTLTGSWKNNTTSESDRLELERLRNDAVSAKNEYLDALTQYNIDGMTLQNRIMEYEFKLSTLSQNESYLKASLDAEMEYYEKGLVREDDVLDAQVEYELFEYDKMIACLEGLSLYYDILIYSL